MCEFFGSPNVLLKSKELSKLAKGIEFNHVDSHIVDSGYNSISCLISLTIKIPLSQKWSFLLTTLKHFHLFIYSFIQHIFTEGLSETIFISFIAFKPILNLLLFVYYKQDTDDPCFHGAYILGS